MQLFSKMRFIAAQFIAYFTDNLWLSNAVHANKMAQLLAQKLQQIPSCHIMQKVEANGVFVVIPEQYIKELQEQYFFYIWDKKGPIIRLMTSFDTTEEDIDGFVSLLKYLISKN